MEIKRITLHHIDVIGNDVEEITLDFSKEIITKYINALIEETLVNPNKRKYQFSDRDTEIKSSISKLINNDENIDEILKNNAKRLLEKEIIVDNNLKSKNLTVRAQKGSLIHIYFKENDNDNVLICKVEHDEIINEKSFDLNRGLNTKKKVFKAFLIFLENKNRHEEIYLNDKNNSKYWWYGFLELEHVFSDEENTNKSLEKFVKVIDRERNNVDFSLDSTLMRNTVIGYYRSNRVFNFSELYDIVSSYTPFNNKFPLDRVKDKFLKLKDDNQFDNQFAIIQKKIDKKIVTSIPLGKGLHLKIDKYVTNLTELIKPYEDENGQIGITILTDEAYKYVKILNKK